MDTRTENILSAVLFIGIAFHFGIGYFLWDRITVINIYYVSIYFMTDVFGFVIYLLAKGAALKGMGGFGMICGTFYLYKEFNDPTLWVYRDYITLGLILSNVFFIWHFTDKFKHKNNKL